MSESLSPIGKCTAGMICASKDVLIYVVNIRSERKLTYKIEINPNCNLLLWNTVREKVMYSLETKKYQCAFDNN